jgi:hypothetical protein
MSLAGESLSRFVGGSGGTSKAGDVKPILNFWQVDLKSECSEYADLMPDLFLAVIYLISIIKRIDME